MKFLSGLETTRYRMLTEEQIENEIPRKSELLFTFLGNTNITILYASKYYFRFSGNDIFKSFTNCRGWKFKKDEKSNTDIKNKQQVSISKQNPLF